MATHSAGVEHELRESVSFSGDAESASPYVYAAPTPVAAAAPSSAPVASALPPSAIAHLTSEWDLESSVAQEAEAQAAALDEEVDPSDPSPLKVLGARGFYLAPSRPWLTRLQHFFPERDSRIFFCIAILLALVISGVWLQQTISGKWLHDIHHPSTTLSIETVTSLPALHGLVTLLHSTLWLNQTLGHTFGHTSSYGAYSINPRTPLPDYTIPAPVFSEYIGGGYSWNAVYLRTQKVSTDPAHSDQSTRSYACGSNSAVVPSPFFQQICLPIGFLSEGAPDPSATWPFTFRSTTDQMCIKNFKLLDPRVAVEIDTRPGNESIPFEISFGTAQARFGVPAVYLTLADVDAVRRFYASGATSPSDPSILQLWDSVLPLEYGRRHVIRTRMSQTIDVAGQARWHTDLEYGGSQAFNPSVTTQAFADYFAAAPEFLARLNRDPNLVLDDDTAPNATSKFYMETCFSPASFQISTVTETRSYNAFSFLADIGGFLNVLAISFALAFPLAQVLVKPRRFLGIWAWNKVVGASKTSATSKANSQGTADGSGASLNGSSAAASSFSSSLPLARSAPRTQSLAAAASGNSPLESAKQSLLDNEH